MKGVFQMGFLVFVVSTLRRLILPLVLPLRAILFLWVVLFSTQLLAGEMLYLKSGDFKPTPKDQIRLELQSHGDHLVVDVFYFIVQFKSPITEFQKTELREQGLELLRYIPDDAFIVKAERASLERALEKLDYVSTFIPFMSDYKISEELKEQSIFSMEPSVLLYVRAFDSEAAVEVRKELMTFHQTKVQKNGRHLTVEMSLDQLERLARLQGVEWIENYPIVESLMIKDFVQGNSPLNDLLFLVGNDEWTGDYTDLTGYESGTKLMGFQAALDRGYDGSGEVVAVADTGLDNGDIDNLHEDFAGKVTSGFSLGLWATSWEDPLGHGTHVAGSAVAKGEISNGVITGTAPGANLVVQGMWSPVLNNLTVPKEIKDLLTPPYDEGVRIHSDSWGNPRNPGAYDGIASEVDDYIWKNQDLLVIFAAGNNGVDLDLNGRIDSGSINSPGTSKNTLTVGASENLLSKGGVQVPISSLRGADKIWGAEPIFSDTISDNPKGIAMFSSRGPTNDGRIKPEVVAPGTNILGSRSSHPNSNPLWGAYNDKYVFSGGTSMSAPLVAGAAAVLRQYLREEHDTAEPSAALMKALLMHTSTDLYPGQFGEVGEASGQEMLTVRPNSEEGFGLVNMDRLTSFEGLYFFDEKTGVAQGEAVEFEVNLEGSSLHATLVYTDAPGSPNASKALVNDLDIELLTPSGGSITGLDRINNFENIETDGLSAGTYTLQIKGHRVPEGLNGAQPYALVITVK